MKNQLFIILISIFFMSSFLLWHAEKGETFAQTVGKKNTTSDSISKIFKDVQESVVQITRENKPTQADFSGDKNLTSMDSGFVYDKEERIITNYNVVDSSTK